MKKDKSKAIYLTDLHFEHKQWLNESNFWRDEIKTYKNRLGEVVNRWTDKEVLAQAEHFQNQFILHNEKLDQIIHDINKHESKLSKYAIEHPVAIDHVHFDDHSDFRDRMDSQRTIYNDMKKEFFNFLRKAM